MKFYDILQLDPMVVKSMAKKAETPAEKRRLWAGMIIRSLLIVVAAVIFISTLTALFGAANTPMAVAIFCMILCLRFVGFGYRIVESIGALAVIFALLTFAPAIAQMLPVAALLPFHLVVYLAIVLMTSRRPEFGNVGLFNFSYIYLTGNPVSGADLKMRAALAALGFVLCAAIMIHKHRHTDADTTLGDVLRSFNVREALGFWQFRMALGMAAVLTAGRLFGVERAMWMAFACAALLSTYPYAHIERKKSFDRLIGVVVGCAAYAVLAMIIPASLNSLLAPIGGFALGLCVNYRAKTACNCFGALTIAQGIYGVQAAALLRVWDAFLGVLFAALFMVAYHVIAHRVARVVPRRACCSPAPEAGQE